MIWRRSERVAGITLVELVVAVAISAMVLAAIGFFIVRVFRLPPGYVEQGGITAQAKVEMERMSDALRNAQDEGTQLWLQDALPCEIEIFSNTDADGTGERVRYRLIGTELRRSVDSGSEEVLARSLSNDCGDATESLFTYFSLGGGGALQIDPAVAGLEVVDRVIIRLMVDVDPGQLPAEAVIETVVTPRQGQ
jgi:hypothetical protein